MAKTKNWYSDQVLDGLREQFPNRDLKIDPREVFIALDQRVNAMAKANYNERSKNRQGGTTDEQFLTRFEWLTPTDPNRKANSYVTLPSNYSDLPNNLGIDNVYFKNDPTAVKKKYFSPVIITTFRDQATYRDNMARNMEGRISVYLQGKFLMFDRGNINATYGDVGLSLVVRDFSTLADGDLYPIPAAMEGPVVDDLITFFRTRLMQPQDLIRDSVDKSV